MIREGAFRLPGCCDRVVIDSTTSSIEAVLDHPDAPNDEWAFGVSRLEISLGAGAWAYFDEQGQPKDPERYARAAKAMLDQLVWWARALRAARSERPYVA